MRWTLGTVLTSGFALFFAMMLWPNGNNGPAPQGAIAQSGQLGQPDNKIAKVKSKMKKEPDLNEITFAKLQKITTINYIDTSLNELLGDLGEKLEMQIFLDVRNLDDVGIDRDTPVTINLANVPAYLGFELMLQQLDLGFTVKEGLIIVTSADDAEVSAVVRYYKADDLLPLFKQNTYALDNNSFQAHLKKQLRSRRLAGPRQESTYNQAIVNLIEETRIEPSPNRKLVEHLMELIEPSGWMSRGGTNGMSAINGILVASCPVRVHIEIENTLERLRRVKGSIPLPQVKARERSPFELDNAPTHSPIYGEGSRGIGGGRRGELLDDKPTQRGDGKLDGRGGRVGESRGSRSGYSSGRGGAMRGGRDARIDDGKRSPEPTGRGGAMSGSRRDSSRGGYGEAPKKNIRTRAGEKR